MKIPVQPFGAQRCPCALSAESDGTGQHGSHVPSVGRARNPSLRFRLTRHTGYNGLMCIDEALERLADLYAAMDRTYAAHAEALGLTCEGCPDNCCLTYFHHHTMVERLYLWEGPATLTPRLREDLVTQARRYVAEAPAETGDPALCPLHRAGRCLLYDYRPMICRLHGVPWVLRRGRLVGEVQSGCHRAIRLAERGVSATPLDRTDLYAELAALEQACRQAARSSGPAKTTVAEMILQYVHRNASSGR